MAPQFRHLRMALESRMKKRCAVVAEEAPEPRFRLVEDIWLEAFQIPMLTKDSGSQDKKRVWH